MSSALAAGFRIVGQVVAQTTAVVAVLYYFGWARGNAFYPYFGLDSSVVRQSVTDYVLRSADVVVRPLVVLGILVLGLMVGHRVLFRVLDRQMPKRRRHVLRLIAAGCVLMGAALCLAGLLGFYNVIVYSTRYPVVPVVLAAGIGLVAYGIHIAGLRPRTASAGQEPGEERDRGAFGHGWMGGTQIAVLVTLAAALILWTVAVYADTKGRQRAQELLRSLGNRPAVIVYSKNDLGLSAPGTGLRVERMSANHGEYRYRYSGLRLLVYSDGRYILLPDHWVPKRDPAFILDEQTDLRFELR